MRAAVVEAATGAVLNVIVADVHVDPPYPGTFLVGLADDDPIDSTCTWSEDGWIIPPSPLRLPRG